MIEPAPSARLRSGQCGRVQRVPDYVLCSSQVQPGLVPPELTTNCSLAIPPSTEIKAANESSRNVAITDLVIAVQISISRCKNKARLSLRLAASSFRKGEGFRQPAQPTPGDPFIKCGCPNRNNRLSILTISVNCYRDCYPALPCSHSRVSFPCPKPKLFCMAVI